MISPWEDPDTIAYSQLLAESFERLTGRSLLGTAVPLADLAFALFHMPSPLVSHGTEDDPVFRYGNAAALALWQMDWAGFTRLPSRLSAEAEAGIQSDRSRLLAEALAKGWTDGYSGIRISAQGQRFRIAETVLWTVTDANGTRHGQAAHIGRVEML